MPLIPSFISPSFTLPEPSIVENFCPLSSFPLGVARPFVHPELGLEGGKLNQVLVDAVSHSYFSKLITFFF